MGLPQDVMLVTTRLRVSIRKAQGTVAAVTGTGFWLRVPGLDEFALVTNKHLVEPAMREAEWAESRVINMGAEYRTIDPRGDLLPGTQFFDFSLDESYVVTSPSADAALLLPRLALRGDFERYNAKLWALERSMLALEGYFGGALNVTDEVVFLGYPTVAGRHVCDETWCFPIARRAMVASHPMYEFDHPWVRSRSIVLVDGMSFGGSSGSPVFSVEKARNQVPVEDSPRYLRLHDARLVGIMSGHLGGSEGGLVPHAGLSYFTKSTVIEELIPILRAKIAGGEVGLEL